MRLSDDEIHEHILRTDAFVEVELQLMMLTMTAVLKQTADALIAVGDAARDLIHSMESSLSQAERVEYDALRACGFLPFDALALMNGDPDAVRDVIEQYSE